MQTMRRKLAVGLAPLVVVGAFWAMPAAAQATVPHYYRGGVLIPQEEEVPILTWGTITMTSEVVAGTTCQVAAIGDVLNPAGGGAGLGEFEHVVFADCSNAECPEGQVEIEGEKYEKEFDVNVPYETWRAELIGTAAPFRDDITEVTLELGCFARNPAHEHIILGPYSCKTSPPTFIAAPEWKNGTNLGNGQSKLVFHEKEDMFGCSEGAFAEKIANSLKIMGFNGSELITVK
jgi:hypothetical protein